MVELKIALPLWIVTEDSKYLRGILVASSPNGDRGVVVFRTRDLAEKAVAPKSQVVQISTQLELLGFAVAMEMRGFTHVYYDPNSEAAFATQTIKDFKATVVGWFT